MDIERVIKTLADLPTDEWRTLAMKTAWHYRTNGEYPVPPKVLAALGGKIPEREVWNDLRKRTTARRRHAKYEEDKYVREQRRERRRRYMRSYMKDYRANRRAEHGDR